MRHLKKLLLIILTGISMNLAGQVQSIGIQFGSNLTNVTSDNTFEGSKFRSGIIGGFNYEYLLKENFSLGADLLYSQQGFKDKQTYTDLNGYLFGGSADSKFYYDYLALPIKFGYSIGNKLKGFAKVGICPSILLKAETTFPLEDSKANFIGYQTFDVKDNVSKFDLGGLIELGADYGILDNLKLFTSITFRHSLTTFSNTEYFSESKMRHYGFALSLGLKYNLKKK
jgi:hypothetical protein